MVLLYSFCSDILCVGAPSCMLLNILMTLSIPWLLHWRMKVLYALFHAASCADMVCNTSEWAVLHKVPAKIFAMFIPVHSMFKRT